MIAIGFFLGFMGYLPVGNINMTVVQLALSETPKRLWAYIGFVALMEFIYCVACLQGLEVLLRNPQWVLILRWAAVFIFSLLGIMAFLHSGDEGKKPAISGISKGIFIAIFNPLQVPFWLVWGVYLTQNKWLEPTLITTMVFAIITALGTVAVLSLYAVGGKRLVEKMQLEQKVVDRFIGGLFLFLAGWQLFQLLRKS